MIRAAIHQVLDKAWLEVERAVYDARGSRWESVGRMAIGDIEHIGNIGEAVDTLRSALWELCQTLNEDWYQLDAHRF